MKHLPFLLIIAILLVSGCTNPFERGCTEEGRICPDGTVVGRTGPNCEFEECPAVSIEKLCQQDSDCITSCNLRSCYNIIYFNENFPAEDCTGLVPACDCIDNKCIVDHIRADRTYQTVTISEFSELKGKDANNYNIEGYVIAKYDECPPCPPGAVCETCVFSIVISEEKTENIDAFLPEQMNVWTQQDTGKFRVGEKYIFSYQWQDWNDHYVVGWDPVS